MKFKINIPFNKRSWIVMLGALLLTSNVFAQQNKITGKVIDETGITIPGANIVIKGTTTGTATDMNGTYTISAPKGSVLQFSFIGYTTHSVKVENQVKIDVRLEPETQSLDEVIVTGYGQSRKSDLTGAISSVSTQGLSDFKTSSVVEALSGQIAGVQITQSDGSPGAGFDIKIRGIGSLNGDSGPLYVVDGFQMDNIDYLSNADIESMEILKDASAAAIYGARGANGVILVTTKSGKVGKPSITYSGSANYRNISKKLDLLSPYEFVKLQMELDPVKFGTTYYREGNDATTGLPYRYQTLDDYIGVGGVDWQDEVFKSTWSQDHNIGIQGGNENTKYNIAYSNYNENGLFKNSSFAKNTAKIRINQKILKNLTLDATLNYVNTKRQGVSTSADNGRFNMLAQILSARPTGGLRLTDEELLNSTIDPLIEEEGGSIAQVNPIKRTESVKDDKRSDMWQGNVALSWEILKGLTFKTAGSYRLENARFDKFYKEDSREAYSNGGKPYGQTQMARGLRWTNFNYLTYDKKIQKHRFGAMVGQELSYSSDEFLLAQSKDFPFDFLENNNLGLGALPSMVSSGFSDKTLLSYFSRLNYNYADRYLFTATVRTDGSSVFSQKNKWAWAPSFSFAWRVNEERFMKSVGFVSSLKLRAGWGILGNDRITNYLSLPLYTPVKYGVGSETVTALKPKHKPNPDLKWEGSMTTNIGIDLALFDNRLSVTADAFLKDTKDLLMEKSLPYVTGFSYQWQNIGSIRNKGVELSVHSVNLSTESGFRWTTDFNISFIRNTLKKLQPGENHMLQRSGFDINFTENDYIAIVGQPLGLMYGYQWDGVYQAEDFVANGVTGNTSLRPGIAKNDLIAPAPGVVKYKDVSGPNGTPDGVIDANDRTVIGNGTPDYYGGFTNNFSYKGFDLSVMFQYSVGNDVYNANRLYMNQSDLERTNKMAEVTNRWTPTNTTSEVPSARGQIRNSVYSRFIEDGSFLRLKNITLGYTLPKNLLRKIYVDNLRLYASAQNLFVATNYSGYDPEVNMRASNPMTPGFDFGAYPKSKVFTVGLDVKF